MNTSIPALEKVRQGGRKGLIVYITAGFPDYRTTEEAVLAAAGAGADLVEIGIPFSDPMADGPVIQQASAAALAAGATMAQTLAAIARIREKSPVALAVMSYINPLLQYGVDRFVREAAAAGVEGLIVPDLPAEECALVEPHCAQTGIHLIQFVAPTSPPERIRAICAKADGFLYCISNTGVTGVRNIDFGSLTDGMAAIRAATSIPTAIGFGIGSPEAAVAAARCADAVIMGSAVVKRLMVGGPPAVAEFVAAVRHALDEGR